MKKITLILKKEIKLSDEAWEFLQANKDKSYLEYRDSYHDDWEDYKKYLMERYEGEIPEMYSEERFNARNEGGTWAQMQELIENGLADDVEDAWHTTYKVNDLGRQLVEQNC